MKNQTVTPEETIEVPHTNELIVFDCADKAADQAVISYDLLKALVSNLSEVDIKRKASVLGRALRDLSHTGLPVEEVSKQFYALLATELDLKNLVTQIDERELSTDDEATLVEPVKPTC